MEIIIIPEKKKRENRPEVQVEPKTEKLEDIIIDQTNYIDEFSKQLDIADERLAKIDEKGSFKSDDEIGWFFKQIKVIQESITRFKQTQNAEKTKKEE